MNEFKEKVAVITGAASGIGRAIAEKFAHEGMKVVLSDIEKETLSQTVEELKEMGYEVVGVPADVSKIDDVKDLAQNAINNYDAVDILVNNAGVGFAGKSLTTIWESPLTEWKWILDVNLWGVIHGINVFTPIMLKQDYECFIINTSSIAGLVPPQPGAGIYSISKHAVVAISEALKSELTILKSKIKVLVLCPGFIATKITDSERNRPKELDSSSITNPELEQTMKLYKQIISNGISPNLVAEELFKALTSEKFYISTDSHMLMTNFVKGRMEAILGDIKK
ncbi:MAG: SDR family NAD(P)-dependent oxidoreductase [Promethearchaeota archaeon]|jgi:short-subunit dehydrogenase